MNFYRPATFLLVSALSSEVLAVTSPLIPRHKLDTKFNEFGELSSNSLIIETRYDVFGQLIYSRTESGEQFYGYNDQGKRTYQKTIDRVSGKVRVSTYPSPGYVLEPAGAQSFVMLEGRRLGRIEHGKKTWYYYLQDHLESSDYLMTSDGKPVEQALYRPYGMELNPLLMHEGWQVHLDQFASILPEERMHHRFTGQYADDATGLSYFNARYYDPRMGTFISPDATFVLSAEECLKSPVECNLYSYAGNNPLKYVDSTGRKYHIPLVYTPASIEKLQTIVNKAEASSAKAREVIQNVKASPEIITLELTNRDNIKYYPFQGHGTIKINPGLGLRVQGGKDDGKVQSPVLTFVHESGHAMHHLENRWGYNDMASFKFNVDVVKYADDLKFDTPEEKRTIREIEQPAAREMGEPVRDNHRGDYVPVSCPTCTK